MCFQRYYFWFIWDINVQIVSIILYWSVYDRNRPVTYWDHLLALVL